MTCHPRRVGFALGNEFSDHTLEKKNYLYLAHSKGRGTRRTVTRICAPIFSSFRRPDPVNLS
jgi:hypothetical protein